VVSRGENRMILHSFFSTKYQCVRQTDRQTDNFLVANTHRQPRLKQPKEDDGIIGGSD